MSANHDEAARLAVRLAYEGGRDEDIEAALAAAEERGRRAGIEEAARLTPALLDRVLHVLRKVAAGQEDSWTSTIARAVEIELRKALAPRDSGHDAILCGPNCPGHAATVRK